MTHSRPGAAEAVVVDLAGHIPPPRLIKDPLRRLAYGTDASFYRLVPALVVRVESEAEVQLVLAVCRRHDMPVTFRAAGTSLSGQAITDGVLVILGDAWGGMAVAADGQSIRLQPGVIGAEANRRLAGLARKIGPDPASIDSCKIGGIAANNASGMCCGTAENSYQTLLSMRLILADGTLVDTGDAASLARFRQTHGQLLDGLAGLAAEVRANPPLAARIARKFAIKNTTGYSLNALVDFSDPVDILQHLIIGSEGTLGFIAEITLRTVPEHPEKASALLLFPDIGEACRTVTALKSTPVSAVELMDRASLQSVAGKPGMPDGLDGLPDGATALLVETRGATAAELADHLAVIGDLLNTAGTLAPVDFTSDPEQFGKLWKIRKGLLPAVGAVRPVGTTVLIEDVAFRIEDLAPATLDLRDLLDRHGYGEAIIFGHALDGNLHFVFTQDFGDAAEVERYGRFMDEVCHLVVDKYDGSLKAEHGTGRNMAPFVELEWGQDATRLMWAIKALLDPAGLLNPGVILDRNPRAHLETLKPLPAADPLVDACIECGFCERMCPSHELTLSPRQRITGWREISRRRSQGLDDGGLGRLYRHHGLDTCAACGLCATACPVGIETGRLVKALRGRSRSPAEQRFGDFAARRYGAFMGATRVGLAAVGAISRLAGADRVAGLAGAARRLTGGRLPKVSANLPTAGSVPPAPPAAADGEAVVYFPTCVSRVMGPSVNDPEQEPLAAVVMRVLARAGFRVILPEGLDGLCCGQPFESKGLAAAADHKSAELQTVLARASGNGRLPIIVDASTCSWRLHNVLDAGLPMVDLVAFLHDRVLPRLALTPQPQPVLLHLNCGARKLGLEDKLLGLARACAARVVVPDGVTCCGFAGDKGFTEPALNEHALRRLRGQVPADAEAGYSSNRTCEIGLADCAGIPFRSIVYLVDRASR